MSRTIDRSGRRGPTQTLSVSLRVNERSPATGYPAVAADGRGGVWALWQRADGRTEIARFG